MNLQEKVQELTINGYEFKLGDYISEGYEIFKREGWLFAGFCMVAGLITMIASFIPLAGGILQIVIAAIVNLGYYHVAHKIRKGETVEFNDFFQPFKAFGDIAGVAIVVGLLSVVGVLLLIIPGIYLAIAWTFAAPIVFFFKTPMWESMEASRKVITKRWWWFFLFGICLAFINILGAMCLVVGLFITIPLTHLAFYAAFNDIFKPEQEISNKQIDAGDLNHNYSN